MASITSLSNSSYNTSSIYGSRNVLTGLASGMDTESMIENAVSGIKMKIQNLTKKRTKVEWQQEAYRSIIDKAVNFNTKYTSYSSKTNLLSGSFFSNAVNTTTNGAYKDKVTASGKTSSDIKLNAIRQLATAASYTVSGAGTPLAGAAGAVVGGKAFDIDASLEVSTVSGSLTFQYGGTNGATFDIKFGELENLTEMDGANNAEKLANAINKKLSEITYTYTKNGFQESTTADKAIKAKADEMGNITFSDGLGNGNSITISSASGDIKTAFGLTGSDSKSLVKADRDLTTTKSTMDYLSDKELGITFNGTTKKISMSKVFGHEGAKTDNDKFVAALNEELAGAFGAGKITAAQGADGKLSFQTDEGDTLSLGGSALEALGFESGDSNFINTGKKLSALLGDRASSVFSQENRLEGAGGAIQKTSPNGNTYYLDSKGNYVDKDGYRVNQDGTALYDFEVNGAHISVTEDTTLESLMNSINSNADAGVKVSYSKLTNEFKFTATETGENSKVEFDKLGKALFGDTKFTPVSGDKKVSDILDGFHSDTDTNFKMTIDGKEFSMIVDKNDTVDDVLEHIGVVLTVDNGGDPNQPNYTASLDPDTNQLVIQKDDGSTLNYSFDNDLSQKLFGKLSGGSYTKGQDAVLDVTINGKQFKDLTRSGNSFDIDGLTINLKGEFGYKTDDSGAKVRDDAAEAITFTTTTDTDKLVDTIKSFVDDYNEMITEVKNAYSTLPAEKSNGARYEPLTAEQEEGYSESELKAYNEKAKQGILFGDTTLSSMYSKMLNAIQPGGTDGQTLREIGISTSYSSGLTTISLDEDKLRAALESDPDKVKNAFTKTREGGSSSDGLMQTMQNTLNNYVKTTGEPKGVLITRAGSIKAPTSLNNNSLQTQINSIDNQIDRWTDKMADQIDRYTTQFSRLEQLIAEMNSQASAFSGLMGGSSGY